MSRDIPYDYGGFPAKRRLWAGHNEQAAGGSSDCLCIVYSRALFAENSAEHTAGLAFEIVDYIFFHIVHVDVAQQTAGSQF